MAKISKVFYAEIDPRVCDTREAGEFYYHFNLLNVDDSFHKSYEEYEQRQVELRNSVISQAMKNGELPVHPRMNTTVFGISSIKQKSILITEI